MKKWLVVSMCLAVVVMSVVFIAQDRSAKAAAAKEVVILRCERDAKGAILITAADRSATGSHQAVVKLSCSAAIADLVTAGFAIQTPGYDSSGAFNYTLVK